MGLKLSVDCCEERKKENKSQEREKSAQKTTKRAKNRTKSEKIPKKPIFFSEEEVDIN